MTIPSLSPIRDRAAPRPRLTALVVAALAAALLPVLVNTAPAAAAPAQPGTPWTKIGGNLAAARSSKPIDIQAKRLAGFSLDRTLLESDLDRAPRERAARTARVQPLVVSLPTPEGTLQRFELVDSPVMEAGLAAEHPEIRTYAGRGLDDTTATVRADLTPLGFHASVRSERGVWFVDPYYHLDQSVYASYYGHDLVNPDELPAELEDEEPAVAVTEQAEPAVAGPAVTLRTYRLALVTDPSYATFFGAENVTAAKVTLVNRVTQVYEDETAIRLVLVNDTDKTNLNTAALATEPNGPCGAAACFTPAQVATCGSGTLSRNQIVLGQLVGAGNYDVGHIGLGVNGGGVAGLGVVGGATKARGCTGLPTPVGDFYAVDYVAHEIGHQFAGNHTFNGTQYNCSGGNRSPANSYEPGSGSSIMAYAGICQQDNLQPHSDPYWSQRSYTEITTFVGSARPAINEVQTAALRGFDTDGDSFTISYAGRESAPIVRGANYTTAGIKAAIEAIPDWPAGATVTVAAFGGTGTLDDTGFQVTFNAGLLAAVNVEALTITAATGASGSVGETVKGGAVDNGGWLVEQTTNRAPVVTVATSYTIPARTPFTLTGGATDADGDTVTYMWEQNDRGGLSGGSTAGTALVNNTKTNGPLFRQFGTAAVVSPTDTLEYYSPGLNAVDTNPTRDFPDLAQIAANNTNAKTGTCPAAPPAPPTGWATNVPAATIDCYSEFLPTGDWVGFDNNRTMHFRLTARDGHPGAGGIGSADTALVVTPTAGPFLVTSQGVAGTAVGGSAQAVTWDVAGTDVAPIGVTEVKISLSTDDGATFPYVLAERTANDGTATVAVPNVATTTARIRVEAVGNVFFDLNDDKFTITAGPEVSNDAPAGGATVQYSDGLSPEVHVRATDPDSDGGSLTATATGLPAGLSLAPGAPSEPGTRPGTRQWTVAGNTTGAPGDYPVTVTVTDETGGVGTTTFTIRVVRENAEVTYTGDTLAYGRNGGGSTVSLRATVRDGAVAGAPADSRPGDVRTATVTFAAGGRTLCTGVVGLVDPANTTVASASCEATLPVGNHQVTATVGGNYTGTATARVEITRAENRAVIGAGTLTPTRSAGAYALDRGSRADFTLLVAQARTGGGATGLATVTFQSGGRRYEVRSTDIRSFGARTGAGADVLEWRSRASLFDVTDPRRAVAVGTGLTLRLTATDRGLLSSRDGLGITLTDGERLLLSSDWNGARTGEINVSGGTILIL
ncbi:M12 family metallo-peptidase [Micromonospora sp. NBC_01796]|uniref:M12 family metallo-peptidase n=1 Tax=Micromonospora sp. NBC_01796 TaxID=2975987 RepID=UPI002DDA62CC|nr:M12 family metallo-peptidase [Micromonospora sp. NBC_01796]WSA84428.1 M12 family metallo-peptidase [Micromonospora sp. NBC_01796]